jgi:hypothetical protein
MPTFPTSAPITAVLDQVAGSVHVVAGDRDDVVVTVLPANPGKSADAHMAQETSVDFANGILTVGNDRSLRNVVMSPKGAVAVTIELPAGSSLNGKIAFGTLDAEGSLGAVDVTLSAGNARVEDADRLVVNASAGSIVAGRVAGPAELKASAGSVRIREIAGDATIRSANGHTTVSVVTGSLTVSGAHGDIIVGRVAGSLVAKASYGNVRVENVESGSVRLTTSYGSVEVGVPEGTVALLDLQSKSGAIRNRLQPIEGPLGAESTAEIHASTGYGDVIVRRPEPFLA